jgi:anthranilate synthase component 1
MPTPPLRRTLAGGLDAAAVYDALYARSPNAFWLDGGAYATRGMSYLGDSDRVLEAHSWAELLEFIAAAGSGVAAEHGAGDHPRFGLGWVGWLAYELGTHDEELAGRATPIAAPKAVLLRVDRAVEIDHATGAVTLLAHDTRDARRWLAGTAHLLETLAEHPPTAPPHATAAFAPTLTRPATRSQNATGRVRPTRADVEPELASAPPPDPGSPHEPGSPHVRIRHGFDEYAVLVEECRAIIRRGDAYQLCLTNRFDVEGVVGDPLAVYHRLRALSPTAHGGYLRVADTALLSASPEQFLAVAPDGGISTSPVKGTRRRDPDPDADAALAAELAASGKEQAENLMIVDLMRNDLTRVCEPGSVRVSSLLEVESLTQVHQLVSTVEGRLRRGLGAVDALAACFPAGSMTGAPKRSAMQHLARLEGEPRGIYSGAFGYLSDDGAAEFSMVIRSIVMTPGRASVGAGGGITALSDPVEEVEETRIKARALLEALGAPMPAWRSG